jgi:hypothetical protein
MHPARYRLAEAMDDQAGALWTLNLDKRLEAGLPLQRELFPLAAGRARPSRMREGRP